MHFTNTTYYSVNAQNDSGDIMYSFLNCGVIKSLIVHIKCNNLSRDDYDIFVNNPNLEFTCFQCNSATFPFMSLNNDQFNTYIKKGVILNDDSDLTINPSPAQKAFMDKITHQINSYKFQVKDDEDDEFEDINDCKYYSAESFRKAKFSTSNSFSVLHLNVHSECTFKCRTQSNATLMKSRYF